MALGTHGANCTHRQFSFPVDTESKSASWLPKRMRSPKLGVCGQTPTNFYNNTLPQPQNYPDNKMVPIQIAEPSSTNMEDGTLL
eukprot:4806995-Amphidinium_carterae.1